LAAVAHGHWLAAHVAGAEAVFGSGGSHLSFLNDVR
jgi:hypothetical protein